MNPPKKLTTQHTTEEQQQAALGQQQAQAGQEFASVEEMLRHDALHTPVPPSIGRRLEKSLKEQEPPVSWWRRWLGGSQ